MNQKRKQQVDDGAYDGRYRQKVVPDKKKKDRKRRARGRVKPGTEE